MTFDDWIQIGVENKWATRPLCATHDGVPMSRQEELEWEEGEDPCQHILRLAHSPDIMDDIAKNYPENYIN